FLPLTPLHIHDKQFPPRFPPYDHNQLNHFLHHIIKHYQFLIPHKKPLQQKLPQLQPKLHHFSNIQHTLNNSILLPQQPPRQLNPNAQKQPK
ncbi:DivIVA domain-containing protein, partial [Bacillus pseudomycoides]|uniref:DivIVA domain-containing protein n=1 Tax=Bacillus pseudomycoides TaxID=64104 RepID=UPI001643A103